MPADVLEVTKKFMREPVRILVKKEELTLEGIRQFYINVEKEVEKHFSVMTFSQQTRLKMVKLALKFIYRMILRCSVFTHEKVNCIQLI